MKLYNPDTKTVESVVHTTALKRLRAAEIKLPGQGKRLATGIRTTRKKKKPPIIKTTEPTCNHCINGFRNIIFSIRTAVELAKREKGGYSSYPRIRLTVYTTGLPPIGLKQERNCLQTSGETKSSSGPIACIVQLHQ